MLIAARAMQGLGAALVLPSTLSIISATFHPRERATAIGIWVGVSSIGLALGPLVGGALIETINWHWIFYVNVPLGAAGVVAALLLVPESRDRSLDRALDLPGLAVVRSSALCAHVRAPRGEPLRLDVGADRRVSRRGRRRFRHVHRGRAAVTKADARPLAVSQRHVQRRQHGQPAQLLRPVRRLLLRFDLPAERARLQRTPHGRDLAAVHDPPGAERSGCRKAHRPSRRTLADGGRNGRARRLAAPRVPPPSRLDVRRLAAGAPLGRARRGHDPRACKRRRARLRAGRQGRCRLGRRDDVSPDRRRTGGRRDGRHLRSADRRPRPRRSAVSRWRSWTGSSTRC